MSGLINAKYHAGLLCVQVGRPSLEPDVMRTLRGKYHKNWKVVVAEWSSFNCAKVLELAHKYGWSGSDPAALNQISYHGLPVVLKEPSLFPHINLNTLPRIETLHQESEGVLKRLEAEYLMRPLWKHQRRAFMTLHRLTGAILDMGMGTGKSMTTIALIGSAKHDFGMIVCPKSVISVWPKEFKKHCKKQFHVYTGTGKKSQSIAQYIKGMEKEVRIAEAYKRPFVFVCNYEAMWQGALSEFIEANKFDYIVFDEVHRLKSPSGTASKFASKINVRATRVFGCTGTLLPHSPADAFGVLRPVDPNVFGKHYIPFRTSFLEMGGFERKQVIGYKNEMLLHRLISSVSFRVTTEDALDLPEATHIVRSCKLESKTRKLYEDMASEMFAEFEGNELTAANARVKVLRLMQITSGVVKDECGNNHRVGNEKASLFADIIEDIDKKEPIVVFCNFTADIQAVKEALEKAGRTVSELSGKCNELREWQEGQTDDLVVQIKAGKEGVDFTRSTICFYYSIGHSLGDYEQSLRRVHRPGQTRPVRYFHLVAEGTVDEDIYKALAKKKDVVTAVLEGIVRGGYKKRGEQNQDMVESAVSMALRMFGGKNANA